MQEFLLEVRESKKILLNQSVEWASFDLSQGRVTIYPGHTPIMGEVMPGELIYHANGEEHTLPLTKGFAHITPEQTILLVE